MTWCYFVSVSSFDCGGVFVVCKIFFVRPSLFPSSVISIRSVRIVLLLSITMLVQSTHNLTETLGHWFVTSTVFLLKNAFCVCNIAFIFISL